VVRHRSEVVRLVGTLTDVTEFKTAVERPAPRCGPRHLTGLPNRELFFSIGSTRRLPSPRWTPRCRPTVMVVDLERLQAGQRFRRRRGRDSILTDAGAAARPAVEIAGYARAPLRRPVRPVAAFFPSASLSASTASRHDSKTLRAPITFNDGKFCSPPRSGWLLADNQPQRKDEFLRMPSLANVPRQAHRAATASKCSSRRCSARKMRPG